MTSTIDDCSTGKDGPASPAQLPAPTIDDGTTDDNGPENEFAQMLGYCEQILDVNASRKAVEVPSVGRLDADELVQHLLEQRDRLDADITCKRRFIPSLTDDELIRARGELALLLHERYSRFGGYEILNESIAILDDLLDSGICLSTEQNLRFLNELGSALCRRFKEDTDVADFERAVSSYQRAIGIAGEDSGFKVTLLLGLGMARYWRLISNVGIEELINQCTAGIACLEAALALPQPEEFKERLCNLYRALHLQKLRVASAQSAVQVKDLLLEETIPSMKHPDFLEAAAMWCWYCSLVESTSKCQHALKVMLVIHSVAHRTAYSGQAFSYCVLIILGIRCAGSDVWSDKYAERSMESLRFMAKLCRPTSVYYRSVLARLTATLSGAYYSTSKLTYLDESIALLSDLDLRCGLTRALLNNLSSSLYGRYQVLGKIGDLAYAVKLLERCLSGSVLRHGECTYATNLAGMYVELALCSHENVGLLDKAVVLLRSVLGIRSEGNAGWQEYHWIAHTLMRALYQRFMALGDASDLSAALEVAQEALARHTEDANLQKKITVQVALINRHLGLKNDSRSLLDEALRQHIFSMQSLPPENTTYSETLGEQAVTRGHIWRISRESVDLDACLKDFSKLIRNSYSRPVDRLVYGQQWIDFCVESEDEALTSNAYDEILELLPRAMPLDWSAQSRSASLKDFSGIASHAALHSLRQKDVKRGIELLESGRALLWSRSLMLRADFIGLSRDLEEELRSLSAALQQTFSDESASLTRRQQSNDFDCLVDKIRQLPGWDCFMRPPSYTQLREATVNGPVIILIGDETESFAVTALSPDSTPIALRLSLVSKGMLKQWIKNASICSAQARDGLFGDVGELRKMVVSRKPKADAMELLLAELWSAVMKPVVQSLQLKKTDQRSRLWILPVDSFTFLPLHAAGTYSGGLQECVSDYCIPSYIPSMKTLLESRRGAPHLALCESKVMLLAEPEAPTLPSLPNTVLEIETISALLSNEADTSTFSGKTEIEHVTDTLSSASIVHLACHGQQDKEDPLQSGFMLSDGKLTVAKLMELRMPNASIALLSACESAMGDKALPDEAIHLAAAMLFIGFKSVVGTMWNMHDADGPRVMKKIYQELLKFEGRINYDIVPRALEAATRELREEGVPASRWATYIHMGI